MELHLKLPSRRSCGSLARHSRLAVLFAFALLSTPSVAAPYDVRVSAEAFDPTAGDSVTVTFAVTQAPDSDTDTAAARDGAGHTVHVHDADDGLVRTLEADAIAGQPARFQARWDGRDWSGAVVPDEAYYMVIERATGEVFDPLVGSGGLVGDLRPRLSRDAMTYKLDQASRVLVRLGTRGGPMLRTLVDWQVRPAGSVREGWDGFDADGLTDMRGLPGFSALVTYVTLPDTSVIATGNTTETYREFKLGRANGRPVKAARERLAPATGRLRPDRLVPPAWHRAPRLSIVFTDSLERDADGTPLVTDTVNTRIELDPTDAAALADDQYEVMLFVDNELLAEAERGYMPLNWRWDLATLAPGPHVLTANISSFNGQVGVVSKRILIRR